MLAHQGFELGGESPFLLQAVFEALHEPRVLECAHQLGGCLEDDLVAGPQPRSVTRPQGEEADRFVPAPQVHQVSGSVYLSPSGRAVIIAIDKQRYMLPRDKFLAVALGEEFSCHFFEVPADETEIEPISPQKEGATS